MDIRKMAKRIAADELRRRVVEVSCYYDTISAQEWFDRNFQVLAYDQDGASALIYRASYGQKYEPEDILDISDYDLYGDSFDEEYETSYKYVSNNWWPSELIEIICKVCTLEEISAACFGKEDASRFQDWDEFEQWIKEQEEYGWQDYDWLWEVLPDKARDAVYDEAKKNVRMVDFEHLFDSINFWRGQDFEDIGLSLKPGWEWYKSRGYLQSDATIVICSKGADEESIDHLIWDCPIYCLVTVDGQEIYVDSAMEDIYSYDKEEAIGIVKRTLGDDYDEEVERQLRIMLPKYPKTM